MSQIQETTINEKLHHSKSSPCLDAPVHTAFQAKYDLNCGGGQHIKKVISEQYIEEKRYMSSSPTPRKHARVELDIHDDDHEKKEGKEGRMGHAKFAVDTTDEVLHIKSEPPDVVENEQITDEFSLYQQSFSRVRSNSLHCTTTTSRKSNTSSVKLSSACASFLANSCRGRPKHSVTSNGPSTSTGNVEVNNALNDQPDSSTGTCEQLTRGGRRRHSISCVKPAGDLTSGHLPVTTSTSNGEAVLCQVCGDIAAGFYCDAYICEACKKFFIRASKLERPRYVCLRQKTCTITKESRVHCQYCRYQKCLQLNMHYSKDGQKNASKVGVQEIPCRVCSAPSSGFHFGALTCEGCKGFFRRMVKEREAYSYKCNRNGSCDVNAMTRNMCKACRYNKCLQIGMSVEGSRIGRQPNAVKHAISIEAKKQAAMKTETDSNNGGNSSPSGFSFDSVILDPCLPGEVDDSLHSVDVNQNPVSVDALALPSRKPEEVKCEQEQPVFNCPDSSVSHGVGHHMSSQSTQQHADVFRIPHQAPPFSPDHRGFHQSSHTTNLNISPVSMSISRNSSSENFRRPTAETFSSIDNQPEDLSMNLTIPRTTTTSTAHFTTHTVLPSTKCNNLPLPSTDHYAASPTPSYEGSHLLSAPLHNPPSSPCYSPAEYTTHHSQFHPSYFHDGSLDQEDIHMPVYQHINKYGNSSPVLNIESYSHYEDHNIVQNNQHMQPEETYLHRFSQESSHSSQPLAHFPSSSPVYNKQQGIVHEHYQTSHYHQHEPELLQQQQALITRQNNRNDAFTPPVNQRMDNSHLDRNNIYRIPSNLQSFPEKSGQIYDSPHQHDFKVSAHQCTHCPDDVHSHIPHFQPQSFAVTSPSCQQKEVRPSPASTPNYDLLEAPSPAPIPEKIAASLDDNFMNMSNDELHIVLLDAAKNLTNFSVVHRAKSNSFDANRFKDVDSTWEKMMEHFHFHAKCIVRFAKRVPGFRQLKIDDQVVLLRMATYSLVILNHSRAFELDTGFYNYFNFSQKEIERIAELFPEFDVIHSHYKHTGIMMQRLGLTNQEYAYMSCILLLNDEYPGLEDIQRTRELKERYMNAFQDYELEHFSNGSLRFGQMLLRLSEFPKISMEHNIAVGLVITKNSQLHIPQLYAEMYAQNSYVQDGSDATRS